MKQLIVVGNGLDLAAKLPTQYDDFFNWLKNNMGEIDYTRSLGNIDFSSSIYNEVESSKKGNSTTKFAEMFDFWSGWFLTISDAEFIDDSIEWNDVENQIDNVLRSLLKYSEDLKYKPLLDSVKRNIGEDDGNWRKSFKDSVDHYFQDWLCYLGNARFVKKWNEEIDFYKILLDELKKFEEKFAVYLCDEVMNDKMPAFMKYELNELENRRKLLNNILKDGYGTSYNVNSQILSFNYTPIYVVSSGKEEKKLSKSIKYIHGSLKFVNGENKFEPGPIIFGIDDTKIVSSSTKQIIEDKLYRFGKTYRIMNSANDASLELNQEINIVKFYGHSLNEADYAYFQSIFDKLDLYGSNVKLCFYYGDFENNDEVEKQKFMDRIYKLIETYGQNTFKNSVEVRGKNLLHKLILEGRIKTKYISMDD